ncbi:MAG: cytidylate kinase-like family protein [Pseudomonadota bacterium]
MKNRSVEQLVEEQLQKWNQRGKERKKAGIKAGPVITISREPGCGGTKIAKHLAQQFDMDIFGGQIIQKVAESVEMSEKVVKSLDEKEMTKRDDYLTALFETRHLWPDRYLHHLTKVIGTIGRCGNAVILGRGANYILPQEHTFRVRFIAPMDVKLENALRTTPEEAKKYVLKTESGRQAFIRQYFNADITDPGHYDMVINMDKLNTAGAVDAVKAAFLSWKAAANL